MADKLAQISSSSVRRRGEAGLLAGLWEFPNVEGSLEETAAGNVLETWGLKPRVWKSRLTAKHIFSHVEWNMTGYHVFLKGDIPAQYLSVDIRQLLTKYPLPNAFGAYLKLLVKES